MNNCDAILIIDDDITFGEILQRALIRRGFKTDVAHNSQEAYTLSEQNDYQRAIIDLKIGAESGLELVDELLLRKPSLHIVMLTGYSSIATAVQAVKKGVIQYLCKPADADEILAAFTDTRETPTIPDQPPSVDRLAWEHIQSVLAAHDGNISATARALGMHRRTLQRKLSKRPVKH
ncbi:response regulator [Gilvimarinus agarilyticus]|uniref:response regulator transcription factor n=1 Tax=unclassified Gilvimarinus TaxID=2642066 RepID=UPI001C08CD06|nr:MULTISPECIES: response regulator [unclassified Gilvimarinus]MBU2885368.1 response regulator [Gilvimarinus agarilyticus]MDO6570267.1 response regulator [Gilvimarinus sp. 2_MG-2023]MDO6746945.1 response regulator [Gilvimarinus sp. 1_MG-2023]